MGVGSTIHCIAGDATGIITAAVITAALGLPIDNSEHEGGGGLMALIEVKE